jgi:signal transduction histidine kinase
MRLSTGIGTRLLRAVLRYGGALTAIAVALGVNFILAQVEHIPSAVFLAAVAVSAYYGGLGPGLFATGLSVLALDYYFFPEYQMFDFGPATWVWLVIFIAVACLISLLNEQQRRLATALRTQDRRKVEFMTVLAHELRNFLSPIAGTVLALRARGHDDEKIQQSCAVMERQVRSMTRLVNDFLDVARVNEGKIVLATAPIDLGAVLAQVVDDVRPMIEARGHQLEISRPAGPLPLQADRLRLEQIFVNLLVNAVKYTDPGGRIWLTVEREGSELLVRVRDTGKGLAPDLMPRLFDMFAQGEPESVGGLGIGLSLVRGLVELHGGRVTAFSEGPGRGSEFVVRLPETIPPEAERKPDWSVAVGATPGRDGPG